MPTPVLLAKEQPPVFQWLHYGSRKFLRARDENPPQSKINETHADL